MDKKKSFIQTWFPYLSAGYFTLLTVLMTWPLAVRMGSQMVGQVGDNIYFVWMIGWFKKALFELHVNPFNVWFLNYPEGWSLAYTEITPAQLILALPFSLIASPTFAYNAAHLLSFILSGLIMSLWVRRLTHSTGAALLAGTAYAFLPFHFAHFLIGHLNLSGLQWFPLFFWGFFDLLMCHAERSEASRTDGEGLSAGHEILRTERDPSRPLRMTRESHAKRSEASRPGEEESLAGQQALRTERGPSHLLRMTKESHAERREVSRPGKVDSRDASEAPSAGIPFKNSRAAILRTGLGLGLIALTSQYYLYMTVLIAAFIWVIDVAFLNRSALRQKSFWQGWLIAGLIALPLIIAAVAPYVTLAGKGELPNRELGVVRPYSAGLTDFLLPSTDHFLWGNWVGSHFNRDMWVEGTLYVGLVNLILAVFAWLKRKTSGHKKLLILMAAGGALALLLAMGTDLHWNGAPVEIPTPAFLQGSYARSTIPIPLPGWLLFKYFPLFAKLRALMRFGIFVLLFICAAAGLGAAEVLKRLSPRWRNAAASALILLVLFDFYPGAYTEFTPVQARPVDTWLASQTGDGAVVQMPFSIAEDQEYTYYTLVHGKPYVGGFFNAFPPAQYKRIKPVLLNFPDAASVQLLRELKVRWVLVDPTQYPDWQKTRAEIEDFGLALEAEPGDTAVFTMQVEK